MSKNELVKKYILDKIDNNIYIEGHVIESTNTIKNKLKVSLTTVRKAIQELVDEGLLYSEQGRGSFVATKPKYHGFKCGIAFTKEVIKLGMTPSTSHAKIEKTKAGGRLAKIFNICEQEYVWKVQRVRYADNNAVMFCYEYFIYKQCPDLSIININESIYDFLETKGLRFSHADQKIEAVLSNELNSQMLKIKIGEPLLKVTLISRTITGAAFSYSEEFINSNEFKLFQTIYDS